jgi:hypothetical protein
MRRLCSKQLHNKPPDKRHSQAFQRDLTVTRVESDLKVVEKQKQIRRTLKNQRDAILCNSQVSESVPQKLYMPQLLPGGSLYDRARLINCPKAISLTIKKLNEANVEIILQGIEQNRIKVVAAEDAETSSDIEVVVDSIEEEYCRSQQRVVVSGDEDVDDG